MDVGDSVSEGNENYSVLLGRALRNNDVDEFFKIYDTNVPKDLTEDQIEHIKEEARKISELPESDFKKRFASAQDYSKGPATMTDQGLSKSAYVANDWKYIDDDIDIDDDASPSGVTSKVPSLDLGSIKRHSRHLNNSSSTKSNHVMGNMGKNEFAAALKLHEDEDQNDSGLYCNKTASESTSDTDQNGSDTEGGNRPGMFHYFKPYDNKKTYGSCQPGSNSAVLYHNDSNYDEAFTASDSDVASPEDSPRETTMLGLHVDGRGQMTELKTIRIHKPETVGPVDRDEDNDSNDDLTNVNVHKRLYSHIGYNSLNFASMDNEDDEIDHSRATSSPWAQKQYSSLGGVGKSFRSYGTYTDSRSDVPRNGPKNNGPRPPFGDPVNVEKIGCSVDDLIPRRGLRDVPDMPASAPITEDRSSEESTKQSEGTKKKKKKKKATSKGEVGEGGSMKVGDSVDENGNPVDAQQSRKKDLSNTFSHGFSSSRDSSSYHNSTFLRQSEDVQKLSNGQWSSGASDDRAEAARKRKAKKSQQESTLKAEDIPDYRGSGKLEDILEFIENTGQGKKKKKAVGSAPPVKTLKDNKKSKLSSPPTGSLDIASDKDDDNEVERMVRDRVKNEPRRLSDLTQMPLSNHSICDARKLDKYDLCLPPDIETLRPKEAEFQLVTKSKKKKRPANSFCPFKDEHFEIQREPRIYKPMRSVTPPPTKMPTDCLATPPSAEKPAERAFSPSAFPVLSSELELDFPTIRVRRNSTGNAPVEGATKANDESAWVEASPLPARETEVESKIPCSPPGKISYAKIAASPKPKNGVPGAISSTSGVSERRHSFGSMDDANQSIKEAVSSLGNKNDHKSQSQELLSNTRIQDDNDRVTARRNLDSAFQINSTATSAIQSALPSKMAEQATGKNIPTVTLPETSESSNVKPVKATSVASNPVSDKPPIPSHTGPRVPKRPKAKCVIFLDKKINDMPKNLGITFGFDENEAHSQGMTDNIAMDPNAPTSKNTCIEGISFKSEPLEQTDGHKLIIPVNGLTLPAQGVHMDQNQQIIRLASECNQNRHAPVCSGTISDNGVKCISVAEEKMWEDLARHESRLGAASSQYNNEDCVRYLVREWEKIIDAKNKGIAIEYHSN